MIQPKNVNLHGYNSLDPEKMLPKYQSLDVGERGKSRLDQPYLLRFKPFSALDDIDDDGLSFVKAPEPRSLKCGDVNEHVFSATVEGNEAEASLDVEPFHCAGLLDGDARR